MTSANTHTRSTSQPAPQPSSRSRLQPAWLSSLSSRLSLALIGIVVAVGVGVLLVSEQWMRTYYEELTQKLNASIAMYVVQEHRLIEGNSSPNLSTIRQLAHQAMVINPIVEVYMLDTEGRIIAHALAPSDLQKERVPLEPIHTFLSGNAKFPLRNTDPKHNNLNKIFSAAAIHHNDTLQGYLYVVLGGHTYDQLEDRLQDSYSGTMFLAIIVMITLIAVVIGLLLFHMLVRRLNLLTGRMQQFAEQHHAQPCAAMTAKDQIDQLETTFTQMSTTIDQQFKQLKEVDTVRRELISNVSHDLRTPLASIQGYLETLTLKNDDLSASQRSHYLHTAMKSSRRLNGLIGDLFELSKLESNSVTPQLEPFALAELMYDIVADFELELTQKQISVNIAGQPSNTMVMADISLIQRVFENLVRNAIAYTPNHGTITLRIEPPADDSDHLQVVIEDTGRGISEQDLPYIFDRFYKNPDQSRADNQSSGLGLAIVKRILELHHSSIHINSQLHQGCRVYFSLAVAKSAQ